MSVRRTSSIFSAPSITFTGQVFERDLTMKSETTVQTRVDQNTPIEKASALEGIQNRHTTQQIPCQKQIIEMLKISENLKPPRLKDLGNILLYCAAIFVNAQQLDQLFPRVKCTKLLPEHLREADTDCGANRVPLPPKTNLSNCFLSSYLRRLQQWRVTEYVNFV